MKSVAWDRADVIQSLKEDVWRYLTQAASTEDSYVLAASRLLQMAPADVGRLAHLHFVLSDEVKNLLAQMPALSRRLATTSALEREVSAERVRGSIRWGETFSERASSGLPHVYVTSPSRRAFDTPENLMLKFTLDAIAQCGRRTGWQTSTSEGVGEAVRSRVSEATKWGQLRALQDVPLKTLSSTEVARVRSGRRAQTYASVLAAYIQHQQLIVRLNREAIRSAIENHALVTRDDPVLLELLCAFKAIKALKDQGWDGPEVDLVKGGEIFRGSRGTDTVRLYYQHTPGPLAKGSLYLKVQQAHDFQGIGSLCPDLVLEITAPGADTRWILLEVKGVERSAAKSARAALFDLLAYRRAFDPTLEGQATTYGIGVAWGREVAPALHGEIMLCSPDTLDSAFAQVLQLAPV